MAEESLANARRFFADAKRLKRAGSRGHAIAFAVLSIEEPSKALLYREVAEGVIRIVKRNPNHVTTFTEGELLDHRFKQGLLANALIEWIRYGPFYEVAEGLTKPNYSKTKVREIFLAAIHAHRVLQVDLQSGGKTARELRRILGLMERLNELKNRGLYVNHKNRKILTPNTIRPGELEEVLDIAEGAMESLAVALRRRYSQREIQFQRQANKALVASIRQAVKRTAAK